MNKSRKFSAGRRKFLKGAAVAGAATLAVPTGVAQNQLAQPQRATAAPLTAPGAEAGTPPEVDVLTADRCGSDFMVDVIKSLDIEYFCQPPPTFLCSRLCLFGSARVPPAADGE